MTEESWQNYRLLHPEETSIENEHSYREALIIQVMLQKFSTRSFLLLPFLISLILAGPACSSSPAVDTGSSAGLRENSSPSESDASRVERPSQRDVGTFAALDSAVRSISRKSLRSVPELTATLETIAGNDWEKVRAVYIWLTENIDYDTDSFFSGQPGPVDPVGVFSSGHSVCEGYSSLFNEIATGLGLEVVRIHGYAKGYGYIEKSRDPGGSNHAWNAVRIDGNWHLFDSTWGAGYVSGTLFIKEYDEFFFDTPPNQFIFSHYPDVEEQQYISAPVSRKLFFRLPDLSKEAFNAGVDALEFRKAVEENRDVGLPIIYRSEIPARLLEFPMLSVLKANEPYRIVIETEAPFAMVGYAPGGNDILENTRGRFIIEGAFPRGELTIYFAPLNAGDPYAQSYEGFLQYPVE